MSDFHNKQLVSRLGENGVISLAAEADHFSAVFKVLKANFPEAQFVNGVGRYCVEQRVFLPSRRDEIGAELTNQLADCERWVVKLRAALESLLQTDGTDGTNEGGAS